MLEKVCNMVDIWGCLPKGLGCAYPTAKTLLSCCFSEVYVISRDPQKIITDYLNKTNPKTLAYSHSIVIPG